MNFILALLIGSSLAQAELTSKGELRLETRIFTDDDSTQTEDFGLGYFGRLEVDNKRKDWSDKLRIMTRMDKRDSSRDQIIVEEAYTNWSKGDFEFKFGTQILNWSATEAFHPADVINSRNLDSNLENSEKIGEPMASFSYAVESSTLSFYYMPLFQAPIIPSSSNRLNLGGGIDLGKAVFVDRSGEVSTDEYDFQWALNYEQGFDNSDLTLHVLQQIDRTQPLIRPQGIELVPIFLPVQQIGGTYEHVVDEWVFKFEGAHRNFKDINTSPFGALEQLDHTQLAFGGEYGWSDEVGRDVAFILEHQAVYGVKKSERAALSSFQNDLLFGYRFALNDIYSQEFFASIIVDIERSHEYLLNASYARRLTDVWTMKTGLRYIDAPQKGATPIGLEALDEANQFYFELSRFF